MQRGIYRELFSAEIIEFAFLPLFWKGFYSENSKKNIEEENKIEGSDLWRRWTQGVKWN